MSETNKIEPRPVAATWYISLDTQCPKCFEAFDVCETEADFLRDVNPGNGGVEGVKCPVCEHGFQIEMEH